MDSKTQVQILAQKIKKELGELIDGDYIFLDLPYYTNIGDTLIWKGTEDFLISAGKTCVYRSSIETYIKPTISKDTVILLQGGGNFGDIWRRHTDFVLEILKDFPENKVIILPQTVHYKSIEVLKSDALQMSQHQNLYICARDTKTFDLVTQYFKVKGVLLLPDMAFCIDQSFLDRYKVKSVDKILFFKRKDVEKADYEFDKYIQEQDVDVREWPSMDKNLLASRLIILLSICRKRLPFKMFFKKLTDWYAIHIYMPFLLRIGIRFISSYNKVYSTRLHGAILSVLLDKSVVFFDNSYGKNSSFYKSWLQEVDTVHFISKTE
nr:polysaccharide pyruvyl transferase family protein [uncultured Carboxylicivirga sp.]